MAKRMTESEKWKDKWFRSLSPEYKCVWIYLLDNCDNAGVIEPDHELIEFCVGAKIDWKDAEKIFNGRLLVMARKWWVVKFVKYQCGKLSPDSPPHAHVIKLLKEHGLWERYQEHEESGYTSTDTQGLLDGLQISQTPSRTFKKDKKETESALFERWWVNWPSHERKIDKLKCKRYWVHNDLDLCVDAIEKGLAEWKKSETWTTSEGQYIPMPYTWLNNHRWEESPAKQYQKPERKASMSEQAERRQKAFDDAVQDVCKELWGHKDDQEGFTRVMRVSRDKFKDLGRNRGGQNVVEEALGIIEFRREREKRGETI